MVLFFECYPNLEQQSHVHSHMALLNIIMGVAAASRATLKTFLAHIGKNRNFDEIFCCQNFFLFPCLVFQGVVIACSYPPVVDVVCLCVCLLCACHMIYM